MSYGLLYNPEFFPFVTPDIPIALRTPKSALLTNKTFKNLRDDPPLPIRSAFFPRSRPEIKTLTRSSPALLRPILKTDQGPPGNFLGFRIRDIEQLTLFRIQTISGVAIPEVYFLKELQNHGIPPETITQEVKQLYQSGDESECYLALERLFDECEKRGIVTQRQADKGRGPFFFIRPAVAEEPIIIPQTLAEMIKSKVINLITENLDPEILATILYFQADVIIKADGKFVIDKINFPDVGFFLSQIDSSGNQILPGIQELVLQLQNTVGQKIIEEAEKRGTQRAIILTRDEVIDRNEDTLEILEIRALNEFLNQINQNLDVQVLPVSRAADISSDSLVLILNIKPNAPGFDNLLQRVSSGEIVCFPHPQVLLTSESLHTYPSILLTNDNLANMKAIVDPVDYNNEKTAYRQLLALQYYLNQLGFAGVDIFYFAKNGITVPAFRYDVLGFKIALNQFPEAEEVELRGLNFKPEDALIIGSDGPQLAAFRFMFVKS